MKQEILNENQVGEKVAEILEQTNLFWNVNKVPLFTGDGDRTPYLITQREDTGALFSPFKSYEVFQNHELAELGLRIAQNTDLEVEKGGFFGEGEIVYLYLKNSAINGIGENNDTVQNYVTLFNSHNGSIKLSFGYSNMVHSCKNSFHRIYQGLENKIMHTTSMKERIEQALRGVEHVQADERKLIDVFFRMAETPITDQQLHTVVKMASGVDIDYTGKDAKVEFGSRAVNKAQAISDSITGEVNQKGATLWGLFNGITKYTTHSFGSPATRDKNKAVGGHAKLDNKVLSYLETQTI